jgi:hypothetical protein
VDQHLEHADVAQQQHADVAEDGALALGEPVILGHPADPALTRHGLGQIVDHLDVLPRWIIGRSAASTALYVSTSDRISPADATGDPIHAPSPVQLAGNRTAREVLGRTNVRDPSL